ncbi:MAG: hypothetical protein AB7U92_01310 [Piscinibacter sp.]|jgi:hypothetical protein
MIPFKSMLDEAGLNRQHIFDLARLPPDLLAPLGLGEHERQLILIGHAGRLLWERVQKHATDPVHPIDSYSIGVVEQWAALALPQARIRFVYPKGLPADRHIGLQRLGTLAGWHHPSPFMVGINARWGSWFAYRAAIIVDSELPASPVEDHGHPCVDCTAKPCIGACPASALDAGTMDMNACHRQRLLEASPCAYACPARQACPVGVEHRYDKSQVRHSGTGSLAAIGIRRLLKAS